MLRDGLQRLHSSRSVIWDVDSQIALSDLAFGTSFERDPAELHGKSLLILTGDQLTTALALVELNGVARRLVLCPPDVQPAQVAVLIADAKAEAIVVSAGSPYADGGLGLPTIRCGLPLAPRAEASAATTDTEWALLTSGTTGPPKMVAHRFDALCAAIDTGPAPVPAPIWSTFYDIRRYGGLQIFLRAIIGGGSLVLSRAGEGASDFLTRLAERGVTHISGTPSHWRRALMSAACANFHPQYVRLSGEIADQPILDALSIQFPQASIGHAYASTEAGVAFEVRDGKAGFPAQLVQRSGGDVELEVVDGRLRIRSARTADRYLGRGAAELKDDRGFVRTSDLVERRQDRFFFVGRGDGVVNVGGLKVHPEEVEDVINRHGEVRMSLVKGRRNPITGEIVVADVVLRGNPVEGQHDRDAELRDEIIEMCRESLEAHKVPAMIRFVDALDLSASGKLARRHA